MKKWKKFQVVCEDYPEPEIYLFNIFKNEMTSINLVTGVELVHDLVDHDFGEKYDEYCLHVEFVIPNGRDAGELGDMSFAKHYEVKKGLNYVQAKRRKKA